MGPKRVLYVENDYGNVGGSVLSLHRLVSHLDRQRFEPLVTFAVDSPSPMVAEFEAIGCEIVRLGRRLVRPSLPLPSGLLLAGARRRALSLAHTLRRLGFSDLPRCLRLTRILRELRIDLVHTNTNTAADLFAIAAARAAGVPVVSHQRAFGRPPRPLRPLVRSVAASLSISEAIRRDVLAHTQPRRALVVYNGVEIPEVAPPFRPLPAAPRIASIGRLVPWKGHHVFLRAAARLADEVPGARFLVVGGPVSEEDRAYEAELLALRRELGLEESVTFLGHVPDVAGRIGDDFDVVVHSAVEPEPFGLILVEAMTAGRPILASDQGACPEIVVHGESGLLYEAGSPEALAAALRRVLTTDGLAQQLAKGGFERARERFDIRRVAREVQDVYAEVLAEAGAAKDPSAA